MIEDDYEYDDHNYDDKDDYDDFGYYDDDDDHGAGGFSSLVHVREIKMHCHPHGGYLYLVPGLYVELYRYGGS
jgi:hypothetical protein